MHRQYFVYILANARRTVLYTRVTHDLVRRIWEHRNPLGGGFATKYNCSRLVFYESFVTPTMRSVARNS